MVEIIEKIKQNKIPCYFISPHLDDAVFSAGWLIKDLAKYTTVNVINIFTEVSEPPYTLSAKRFLAQCKYNNAQKLFDDRKKEDAKVLNEIGVSYINLPFQDSIWRKLPQTTKTKKIIGKVIPEFLHTYPIYRLHIKKGFISTHDDALIKSITEKLKQIINPESFIFCPVGIGLHNDHIIVRNIVRANFNNVIMWTDYPYILEEKSNPEIKEYIPVTFQVEKNSKAKLIKGYKSQADAIFKNKKIDVRDEVYYFPEYLLL